MKQFVTLLFTIFCLPMTGNAQTYLEHLTQKTPGQGTVTVKQSKAIDELVNGKIATPQDNNTKTTPLQQPQKKDNYTQQKANEPQHKVNEPQHKTSPDSLKKGEQHHEANKPNIHENNAAKAEQQKEENETPMVDMRKKVMRKSYKVTGYRVQAYAGGNSRNDRLKAEQTGNALKMKFPEQPVYVHFYSPRWICRMGNFKSLAEAQKVLAKVKALGYKQACLVKGQSTVQY